MDPARSRRTDATSRTLARELGKTRYERADPCSKSPSHGRWRFTSNGSCCECIKAARSAKDKAVNLRRTVKRRAEREKREFWAREWLAQSRFESGYQRAVAAGEDLSGMVEAEVRRRIIAGSLWRNDETGEFTDLSPWAQS